RSIGRHSMPMRRQRLRRQGFRAPGSCVVDAVSCRLPSFRSHGETAARIFTRSREQPPGPNNIQQYNHERQDVRGPYVRGIPAHVEKVGHRLHGLTASRIQLAERSRLSTSPRNRTGNTATKKSVKPRPIIRSGMSIEVAMVGAPNFITDGAWCKEFHQITE